MKKFLACVALAAAAGAAHGQVWAEAGDAGNLLTGVQMTSGAGPLELILGGTAGAVGDWVDAYCIHIVDPRAFYATTSTTVDPRGFAGFDTRLWLFDHTGAIVLGNDDTVGGGLASTISDPVSFGPLTGGAVHPTAAGIGLTPGRYILAIGGFSNDALDAAGAEIITLSGAFTDLHGPNPAGPLASWEDIGATGDYAIALHGATYCIPTPGSMAILGIGGLVALRRRR